MNDVNSEGGTFSAGSESGFNPGPSRRRDHRGHGRHGDFRPGNPFDDHRHRHRNPTPGSDSDRSARGAQGFPEGYGAHHPGFGSDTVSQAGNPEPEEAKINFYEVLEVPETATADE